MVTLFLEKVQYKLDNFTLQIHNLHNFYDMVNSKVIYHRRKNCISKDNFILAYFLDFILHKNNCNLHTKFLRHLNNKNHINKGILNTDYLINKNPNPNMYVKC